MQISQTKEQIAALRSFQDHCEIESITLQSCSATRAKANARLQEPYAVKSTLCNVAATFDGEHFVADVSFEYDAWDSSDPAQRIFLVHCSFEVCYRMRDGYIPSEYERSSFSRGTVVFNCWPYAREFFRDITSRLGHSVPPLPLLRITPKKSNTPNPVGEVSLVLTPETPDSP